MAKSESLIRELLEHADVKLEGERPWDITVHEPGLYDRLLRDAGFGLGESYMDAWWDCEDLSGCIYRILRADLERAVSPRRMLLPVLKAKLTNVQRKSRAAQDVSHHYDRGNLLFRSMLDKSMTYSCAYWKDAADLDAAQEAKLDLVCRKIGLKSGQRVLDIGCGWGSFLKHAVEKYGVSGVGITLSKEQVALGTELCTGLPVELRLQDYRAIDDQFDHIVSIGMFEHIGPKNYSTYMNIVRKNLKDDGLFLLHTIGAHRKDMSPDAWTDRYIFPGGQLPAAEQIPAAVRGLFIMEDMHNIGVHYTKTLDAWYENFEKNWDSVLSTHYDSRFFRMWRYFLLSSSGAFRARRDQVWQFVFSKRGVDGGYHSIR